MPECEADLERDSRWPGFFPSPVCIVTVTLDGQTHMERVVGPSIVNRFPYVMALSLCTKSLSERHYPRKNFNSALEAAGEVAVQFLEPGHVLDRALAAIEQLPDEQSHLRIVGSGLDPKGGEQQLPRAR